MSTLKTAVTDWLRLKVQGSTPATPATGYGVIYDKNGSFAYKNAAGTETVFGAGGDVDGPASATDGHLAVFDGTTGKIIKDGGAVPTGSGADYILVRDEKSTGTTGGTFTAGAWQTRDITAEISDTGGHCTLPGSNVIRLAAGTYQYKIKCPAFQVGKHQARLYDVTGAAVVTNGEGSCEFSGTSTANGHVSSFIIGVFTIAGSNDFRIEHYGNATVATNGFGYANGFGLKEIYTIAEFWKVA